MYVERYPELVLELTANCIAIARGWGGGGVDIPS